MPTAEMVIASVRDQIPDPNYTSVGALQDFTDGQLMRQQALVRWLNAAMSIVSTETRCVKGWTALPAIQSQDFYALDPRFFHVITVWYDGWPLEKMSQADYFYRGMVRGTAWDWAGDGRGPAIRVALWPYGLRTPGDTFLNAAVGPNDTSIVGVSLANFGASGGPGLGWFRMENGELCTYRTINTTTNTLGVVTRGQGGTLAVAHTSGGRLQECNIWAQGYRIATPVALPMRSGDSTLSAPGYTPGSFSLGMTDALEIPDYLAHLLEIYMLGKVREAENERQEAAQLLKEFYGLVGQSATDAKLRDTPTGLQVRLTGGGYRVGRLVIP